VMIFLALGPWLYCSYTDPDNVICDGTVAKLTDCRKDSRDIHDCTDAETAGVICA